MTDSSDALKDRKRSDEKIREQRAESLFRYIEVKKKELRDKKTELLKAIIVKQRLKIRQSDVEWEKKRAQLRPLNRSPSKKCKKRTDPIHEHSERVTPSSSEEQQLRTSQSMASRTVSDSTTSLAQSHLTARSESVHSSRWESIAASPLSSRVDFALPGVASRVSLKSDFQPLNETLLSVESLECLKEQDVRSEVSPAPAIVTRPIRQKISLRDSSDDYYVKRRIRLVKKEDKKSLVRTIKESDDSSAAVLSVFKSPEAYRSFKSRYREEPEESGAAGKSAQDPNGEVKASQVRIEKAKQMHELALRNRGKISHYLAGRASQVAGIPSGFRAQLHARTDTDLQSQTIKEEEVVEEKVNLAGIDNTELHAGGKLRRRLSLPRGDTLDVPTGGDSHRRASMLQIPGGLPQRRASLMSPPPPAASTSDLSSGSPVLERKTSSRESVTTDRQNSSSGHADLARHDSLHQPRKGVLYKLSSRTSSASGANPGVFVKTNSYPEAKPDAGLENSDEVLVESPYVPPKSHSNDKRGSKREISILNAERHSVLSDIAVMMEDNEEKEIDNNSFSDEIQIVVPTPQVPEQSERGSVTTRKAQYKTSMSFRRDLMHDYPNQENSLYKEFSSQSSPTQKALKPLPRAKKTWDHISMDAVAEFGSTVSTSEQKQRQKESLPLLSIFKTDRGKRKDASEELFGSLIKGISYSTTRSAQTMDVTQRILLPRSVRYFPAPLPESDHDEQQAIVESTA